jgi:hypothetical protein
MGNGWGGCRREDDETRGMRKYEVLTNRVLSVRREFWKQTNDVP